CCISNNSLPPACSLEEGVCDIKAVYKHFIDDIGVDPGCMSIAGDSLGAGMATLALVGLRDEGVPLPNSACLMSPITDLADQVDDDSDDFSSSAGGESAVLDDTKSSSVDGITEKPSEAADTPKDDSADTKKDEETGGLGDDI
ncbi:AP-4 complex subunit mu-1, partial [Perkinsus olseni]